jgi:hypothetical protein
MKTFLARLIPWLLAIQLFPAAEATYRLEFQIRGGAISRLLLVIPLRIFYDASAAIDLTAHPQPGGVTCFSFAGVPRPAHILRTLGFSGRTLALLTVVGEEVAGEPFSEEMISHWRRQEPGPGPSPSNAMPRGDARMFFRTWKRNTFISRPGPASISRFFPCWRNC